MLHYSKIKQTPFCREYISPLHVFLALLFPLPVARCTREAECKSIFAVRRSLDLPDQYAFACADIRRLDNTRYT